MNATVAKSLYERLGGYDGYWQHRGDDGLAREKQLLIDFLCASAGGPMYYTGRDMKLSHKGMRVSEADWQVFVGHVKATLDKFQLPAQERADVLAFIDSTKADIVEV
jgi:hemoglobin